MGSLWSFLVAIYIASNFAFLSHASAERKITFKKQKIQLTQRTIKKTLQVDIAETPEQLSQGLMFREKMGENEGMLFIFQDEQIRGFWMKNTLIDLDIAYFDKNKKLIDIQHMKSVSSIMQTELPTYPSKAPAQYALEMNKGWFQKNKITEGAELKILSRLSSK